MNRTTLVLAGAIGLVDAGPAVSAAAGEACLSSGDDKVRFVKQFTRFDKAGKPIATYDSLYIVTRKDDHWGTQFRPS